MTLHKSLTLTFSSILAGGAILAAVAFGQTADDTANVVMREEDKERAAEACIEKLPAEIQEQYQRAETTEEKIAVVATACSENPDACLSAVREAGITLYVEEKDGDQRALSATEVKKIETAAEVVVEASKTGNTADFAALDSKIAAEFNLTTQEATNAVAVAEQATEAFRRGGFTVTLSGGTAFDPTNPQSFMQAVAAESAATGKSLSDILVEAGRKTSESYLAKLEQENPEVYRQMGSHMKDEMERHLTSGAGEAEEQYQQLLAREGIPAGGVPGGFYPPGGEYAQGVPFRGPDGTLYPPRGQFRTGEFPEGGQGFDFGKMDTEQMTKFLQDSNVSPEEIARMTGKMEAYHTATPEQRKAMEESYRTGDLGDNDSNAGRIYPGPVFGETENVGPYPAIYPSGEFQTGSDQYGGHESLESMYQGIEAMNVSDKEKAAMRDQATQMFGGGPIPGTTPYPYSTDHPYSTTDDHQNDFPEGFDPSTFNFSRYSPTGSTGGGEFYNIYTNDLSKGGVYYSGSGDTGGYHTGSFTDPSTGTTYTQSSDSSWSGSGSTYYPSSGGTTPPTYDSGSYSSGETMIHSLPFPPTASLLDLFNWFMGN